MRRATSTLRGYLPPTFTSVVPATKAPRFLRLCKFLVLMAVRFQWSWTQRGTSTLPGGHPAALPVLGEFLSAGRVTGELHSQDQLPCPPLLGIRPNWRW